jgi:hypothetical protein
MPEEVISKPLERLNPQFEIDGKAYGMATQYIASVPSSELGVSIGTLPEADIP